MISEVIDTVLTFDADWYISLLSSFPALPVFIIYNDFTSYFLSHRNSSTSYSYNNVILTTSSDYDTRNTTVTQHNKMSHNDVVTSYKCHVIKREN